MESYDVVIIGGGPAGLAAAVSAKEHGIDRVLILERDRELGGILNQCIHNGFGLQIFKEELTGPEYAKRFINRVKELELEYKLNTMVININEDKKITAVNREDGLFEIQSKSIILAMGCRERSRGALNIPGYRPAGIFSAGTAQRLVNMENYMPGKEVVILGSGDIGLIMARRMTLEGAKVKVVAELLPYSGGLKRNIVQCLNDYDIPLKLSHTVVDIHGKDRVTGVTIAKVDEKGKPILGTEEYYSCDTLLLSVGLIPENELSKELGVEINPVTNGPRVNESLETTVEGVFACGNVLHVHDLVDYVTLEAQNAGKNAAEYIARVKNNISNKAEGAEISIIAKNGIRYTVPEKININRMEDSVTIRFRVGDIYKNSYVSVFLDGDRISRKKRLIMVPSEMEEVKLEKAKLAAQGQLKTITIEVEKE
ncbi:MAG: FAD-dependent oxidoreductase [Clostridiaceae bacterium]|jgi:NADPH-dependent 2,4-dienoyl-CoA reductase/sulfur reductase-like enzyme|nr:FAD-dependent oxidoreductase [Clostridiaceae bacterium]